ncbi:EpsG family protein [Rahnella sp. PCH160]|uniref:EpsG family protein n=1 Tax=Rahnella sp. PCH160 TaxID=3447928 RepID=UPI0039FC698C
MFYFIFVTTAFYVFIISLLFTQVESKKIPYTLYLLPMLIILSIIIGSRTPGVDHDYQNYISWLDEIGGDFGEIFKQGKDVGFILIYMFTSLFDDSYVLFFIIIAFLSLFFKLKFASLVFDGQYCLLIFLVILSRFIIVHDFTQIRAGLAIAMASYGVLKLLNKSKILGCFIILLGVSVHLSAILLPLVYLAYITFANRKSFTTLLLALPVAGIFMGAFIKTVLPYLDSSRINVYLSGEYATEHISLFSFYYLVRLVAFYGVMFFMYRKTSVHYRIYPFVASISLFLNAAFSWNDSIALRLVEVLGFFDMALLVLPLLYLEKNSKLIYFSVIGAVSVMFFVSSTKIVNDYISYFF